MKHTVVLTVTSLLTIVLLILHVADDIARGMDTIGPHTVWAVLVLGLWLYAALLLNERRTGYFIILLGSILGFGVVVLHLRGASIARIATSSGGFFFVSTLFAMGGTSVVSFLLSVQGLWRLRRGHSRSPNG